MNAVARTLHEEAQRREALGPLGDVVLDKVKLGALVCLFKQFKVLCDKLGARGLELLDPLH